MTNDINRIFNVPLNPLYYQDGQVKFLDDDSFAFKIKQYDGSKPTFPKDIIKDDGIILELEGGEVLVMSMKVFEVYCLIYDFLNVLILKSLIQTGVEFIRYNGGDILAYKNYRQNASFLTYDNLYTYKAFFYEHIRFQHNAGARAY